jgi:hypothetical protein
MIKQAKHRCDKIRVGGISATLLPEIFEREGVEVHKGLWDEVENHPPDYTLLPKKPDYSIAYLSRGCVRKCGFCMVSTLEPKFGKTTGWQRNILPGAEHILFYDNNFSAIPVKHMEQDVKDILEVIDQHGIKTIDFNQGLDCRVMTERKADLLAQLPIDPVRFAFDGMQEDGHWQKAIEMMVKRGKRNFVTMMLYNFDDTPGEFHYRVEESAKLAMRLGVHCKMFPMRYQPIMEVGNRSYVGKHWSLKEMKGVTDMLSGHSANGIINCSGSKQKTAIDEMNLFFGKDQEEFVRLLNYPKLRQLMKIRKAERRNWHHGELTQGVDNGKTVNL